LSFARRLDVKGNLASAWIAQNAAPLTIIAAVTVVEMTMNFARYFSDSGDYLQIALNGFALFGIEANIRFGLPFLAGLILRTIPIGETLSSAILVIAILNCLFWAGGVGLAFWIGEKLMDKNGGFLMALMFTASVAVLAYGAAILTDMTAYFFSGLALAIALAETKSRPRGVVEGMALAAGPFFHFSAALGLFYAAAYRLRHRSGVWTLLGVLLAIAAGAYMTLSKGWLFLWVDYARNLLTAQLANLSAKLFGGPQYAAGTTLLPQLMWTFNISALFGSQNVASYLWFGVVILVGFVKITRKVLLTLSVAVTSVFSIVFAGFFMERWLFVLWPFFIPVIVSGLRNLARIPAYAAKIVFSRPGLPRVGILLNPDFYVAILLLIQAFNNTVAVTYDFFLHPPII
jgi:hypothetical protein